MHEMTLPPPAPLTIPPDDLICLNAHASQGLFRIDLLYAREDNPLFLERIYRPGAQLYGHKILAEIVLEAAKRARDKDLRLVITDCLRTTTAQARMLQTRRVQENPHWLEEPRLLSPPGMGAHPRGMAIDVTLETSAGALLDMGTVLDFLAEDARAAYNPAHRAYPQLSEAARKNRALLDDCMFDAAKACGHPLIGLAEEWWDYRLPVEIYNRYAPLSDDALPQDMRLL